MTNLAEAEAYSARIAVAIPCFNEAAAIASVIESIPSRASEAEIVVFDNNSTDGTGEIARGLGIRVIDVAEQGKGHVVRAAFGALGDFDVVVLTDGDGTYPAESAPLLVGPLLVDAADMAVGARRPVPGTGAMSPVRGFGNLLIRVGFSDLDRTGHHGFAFRLSHVQSAVSRGRSASLERLRDRDRARQRGGCTTASCRRNCYPVSRQGRRHREQAACVSRRTTDPGDDLVSKLAASALSAGSGLARALWIARGLCESRICGRGWFRPHGAVGAFPV